MIRYLYSGYIPRPLSEPSEEKGMKVSLTSLSFTQNITGLKSVMKSSSHKTNFNIKQKSPLMLDSWQRQMPDWSQIGILGNNLIKCHSRNYTTTKKICPVIF